MSTTDGGDWEEGPFVERLCKWIVVLLFGFLVMFLIFKYGGPK